MRESSCGAHAGASDVISSWLWLAQRCTWRPNFDPDSSESNFFCNWTVVRPSHVCSPGDCSKFGVFSDLGFYEGFANGSDGKFWHCLKARERRPEAPRSIEELSIRYVELFRTSLDLIHTYGTHDNMSISLSRPCAVRRKAPSPRPRRSSARPRHQECDTAHAHRAEYATTKP